MNIRAAVVSILITSSQSYATSLRYELYTLNGVLILVSSQTLCGENMSTGSSLYIPWSVSPNKVNQYHMNGVKLASFTYDTGMPT